MLRKILFWAHLSIGSIAGIIILIMSVTGVMLAYERQTIAWVDRAFQSDPPTATAARMPIGDLLAKACSLQPVIPSNVAIHSNARSPVEFDLGRDRAVYFNAYTGDQLGAGSQRTRDFFQNVEGWHRWLGAGAKYRPTARLITGISNLGFLILVSSGLFLWAPKSWSWQKFKGAMTWRRKNTSSRARDWNWHTITGFWCAIPLLIIVSCGVVMSFPWANNLLYRMTGNPPPPQQQAQAARPAPDATAAPSGAGMANRNRGANGLTSGNSNRRSSHADSCSYWDVARLNLLWNRAEGQVSDWQTISLRPPMSADGPAVFSIDQGDGGRPDKRGQLTLDWHTGEMVRWEPFSSYNEGRQLRAWVRFSHTGEAGGVLGETIAALATGATVVLVFTGLALAWRRFFGQAVRSPGRSQQLSNAYKLSGTTDTAASAEAES